MEYGIVTTNKFHFLSDDEDADPSKILSKAAEIKKVKGTSINKVPPTIAPEKAPMPKIEKPQTETANKENAAAAPRNTRGRGRGGPRDRVAGNDARAPKPEGQQDQVGGGERRGRGGRGRGNGERRFDGERGERRFDGERRERQFDGERKERRFDGERRERHFDRPRRTEGDVAPVEGGEERPEGERRPGRGGRGFGGRGRGAPRQDRISGTGTGIRANPKKDGHGKGNWGTEQDELTGETEPVAADATENAENATKEGEADAADKNDSGVEVEKEEDKQPVGMTLSEWKEKNKAAEAESFNVRKPNDDKKLNLAPLKKAEDNDKDNEEFVVLRREPREKHVDISVSFASAGDRGYDRNNRGGRDERRGGRGGRGGDRGQRGSGGGHRGGDRSNRGGNFNLVNDQFPALGAH